MSRHFGSFYIDGQWTTPLLETTTPIIEAATEQRLGDLPEAGAKEVDLVQRLSSSLPVGARVDRYFW